jgi:thioredoxin reductase (NADPH)
MIRDAVRRLRCNRKHGGILRTIAVLNVIGRERTVGFVHIVSIETDSRPFRLIGDSGDHYLCDALIYATGAQAKWLGIPSEETFRGFGVSACATCDGFFFRDKRVAIVGGGNTAVEEALYLANLASAVTLVHRRDTLRAERILQDRLFAHPKVTVRWNSEVDSVVGEASPVKVNGLVLTNRVDGTCDKLDVDGVFVAIGHAPASSLLQGKVDLHADGYIKVQPGTTTTNVRACLRRAMWRMPFTVRP